MKTFDDLKLGDVVHSPIGGDLEVILFDLDEDGIIEMRFKDEFGFVYPIDDFYPKDWELCN